MTFAKFSFMEDILKTLNDYSNLISLLLSCVAIIIAVTSLICTRSSERALLKRQIREKEAELYSINEVYFNQITTYHSLPGREEMEVRVKALKKQIEFLKRGM